MLSASACTDHPFTVKTDGESVTITGYLGGLAYVSILESINDMPVTVIGKEAFAGDHLTGISIPDSVTVIDSSAFYQNPVMEITIPQDIRASRCDAFPNQFYE
ncbi:MAG: leucine-rich repeat domain-containing protein [Spirochaetaceae bacterium]|nr:leucine-rich repeat domain-containing protein [Spirochaetaceae bacterium]